MGAALTLPRLHSRHYLIAAALALVAVPNAVLIGEAVGFMLRVAAPYDWQLFTSLQLDAIYDSPLLYSPLFAYAVTPFTVLGLWGWRLLHVAALLLLPRKVALIALASWPFWYDVAHANVMTFAVVLGWRAWRGDRWAVLGFAAFCMLVPRPVYLPLLAWVAWRNRTDVLAVTACVGLGTLATGQAGDYLTTLASSPLTDHPDNIGPTGWIGQAWFLVGLPLAGWLTLRGHVAWAGLALSSYVTPYYLLVLLWQLRGGRRRVELDVAELRVGLIGQQADVGRVGGR